MQLVRNILQLFLLTPGHVSLHSLVDTVNQRNLSGNSQVVILRPTVNKVVMNIYERLSRE